MVIADDAEKLFGYEIEQMVCRVLRLGQAKTGRDDRIGLTLELTDAGKQTKGSKGHGEDFVFFVQLGIVFLELRIDNVPQRCRIG